MDNFLRFAPMLPLLIYGGYCVFRNANLNLSLMALVATIACLAGSGQGGLNYLFDLQGSSPNTHSGIVLIVIGLSFLFLSRFLNDMYLKNNVNADKEAESSDSI